MYFCGDVEQNALGLFYTESDLQIGENCIQFEVDYGNRQKRRTFRKNFFTKEDF